MINSSTDYPPWSAVKPAAVAGLFYPSQAAVLKAEVDALLSEEALPPHPWLQALVVPHAGFPYSGPIAASAYHQLIALDRKICRIVLLGPTHHVGFSGIGLHSAERFATPLGEMALDRTFLDQLSVFPFVHQIDQAYAQEHCLEVQLPFLQRIFKEKAVSLVPLLVGQARYEDVTDLLRMVVEDEASLILVTSDLSHYLPYAEAQAQDRITTAAIQALAPERLGRDSACGRIPLAGLLLLAKERGWWVKVLDQRNSGDTAGSRDRVVGYGAYAFYA